MEHNGNQQRELEKAAIRAAFPLHMREELEVSVNQSPYVVGVNSNYPAELRERISAAIISYFLQNKSIDYTRKRYQPQYDEDPGGDQRLDRHIRRGCLKEIELRLEAMKLCRCSGPESNISEHLGECVSEATIARLHFCLTRAFAEADKGALFEALVILRMSLEQLAWAAQIRSSNDRQQIVSKSVTKSVGELSRNIGSDIGRLYGWLSDHAHWSFDAHVKTFDFSDDKLQVLLANCTFKAKAYAAMVVFSEKAAKIIDYVMNSEEYVESLDRLRAEHRVYNQFPFQDAFSSIINIVNNDEDLNTLNALLSSGD